MASFKYVVLGGGNASGYAAKEFAAQGVAPGELCIITDEAVVAYERPALSKAYLNPEGHAARPRLPGFHTCVGGGGERQDPAWYEAKGIEYKTNTRVTKVDVASKKLTTASGDEVSYEKLIYATGTRAVTLADFKTPGADLKGVHVLRDVKDADALVDAIAACKAAGGKAVCIGGGYIGMECAAALQVNGLDVTMVFPEDRMMSRLFNPSLAAFYENFYAEKGIKIQKGALATALEGDADGRVSKVLLKDGSSIDASLVVVGVGARANAELLDGQVELNAAPVGGVKVDGSLATSNPDVYAVGDVAAFPLKMYGGAVVRQEHVTNCRAMATHAVQAIMGKAPGDYDYLPMFYSRVYNLSWQFYGSSEGDIVEFGDKASGKFGAFWVKDGKVVGAFLESGSPEEFAAIKTVALKRPDAPADLATAGLAFASKL